MLNLYHLTITDVKVKIVKKNTRVGQKFYLLFHTFLAVIISGSFLKIGMDIYIFV